MEQVLVLKNRCVISISGQDRKSFLQGLITNDVSKAGDGKAFYALMLSPVGRFLYDFFIVEKGEKLFLDCCLEKVDEIVQKLSFYKLRSKVEIGKEPNLVVVSFGSLIGKIGFVDSRNSEMGFRSFVAKDQLQSALGESGLERMEKGNEHMVGIANSNQQQGKDLLDYNFRRINLKLPDDSDLTFEKSFPLEFGFDDLNAVDYQKGCYVGQETTARMHYKGTIRKKVFLVEVLECKEIDKGTEIEAGDKKIGEILSSVFYQEKLFALALIKNVDNEGKEINFGKMKLTISQNGITKEIRIIK